MKLLLITVLAMSAVVSADPAVYLNGGLVSAPFTSAALVAPAPAPVVAPLAAPVASVSPYSPLAPVSPVAPLSPLTQVLSDYRYGYGSSYSYQDIPVVNSALTSLPYSLPYAYAADWYYRK